MDLRMITPEPSKPGQESVWTYPRPAVAQACTHTLKIIHRGIVLAETRRGVRTLETSHPPSYYFPRGDVAIDFLHKSARSSICEWKGKAAYFDVTISGGTLRDIGWSYPSPTPAFQMLKSDPATGEFLWRLDHVVRYRPIQGCAREHALVTCVWGKQSLWCGRERSSGGYRATDRGL
jgi:uncharacterized protein (DUF427 family)